MDLQIEEVFGSCPSFASSRNAQSQGGKRSDIVLITSTLHGVEMSKISSQMQNIFSRWINQQEGGMKKVVAGAIGA
jgi:hypothetical protein